MENEKGTAEVIRDILETYTAAKIEGIERGNSEKVDVLLVPKGREVVSLKKYVDEYRTKPERRAGVAKMLTLSSFIDHVNRFKDADSVVFADNNMKSPKVGCVFDYHRAGHESDPRFGLHRSVYEFPLSDEWREWQAAVASGFETQTAFAEFVENHIDDVYPYEGGNPKIDEYLAKVGGKLGNPARLMDMARGLSITETCKATQAINRDTGEVTIQYETDHGPENVRPPSVFMIAIPVFVNGPVYSVLVRVRYRKANTGFKFFVELYRDTKVFEDAFNDAVARVREETGIPLLVGFPEIIQPV